MSKMLNLSTVTVVTSLVVGLASYAIWRVRREFVSHGRLSVGTTLFVWAVYLLHAGLTVVVAWQGLWPVPISHTVSLLVGGSLVVIGFGIAVAGVRAFRSLSRMSGRDEDELVTTGIYRWSRNPQNTGWISILIGMSVLGRSALAFVLVVLFIVLVHIYLVFVEEPHLVRIFGSEYGQYRAQTPRYLWIQPRKTLENE